MAQTHRLVISNSTPGGPLSGVSSLIMLDGQELKGVKEVSFKVKTEGLAFVTITLSADIEISSLLSKIRRRRAEE